MVDAYAFISPAFRNQIPWGYEWFGDKSKSTLSDSSTISWVKL